jgi:hypothetical protein
MPWPVNGEKLSSLDDGQPGTSRTLVSKTTAAAAAERVGNKPTISFSRRFHFVEQCTFSLKPFPNLEPALYVPKPPSVYFPESQSMPLLDRYSTKAAIESVHTLSCPVVSFVSFQLQRSSIQMAAHWGMRCVALCKDRSFGKSHRYMPTKTEQVHAENVAETR